MRGSGVQISSAAPFSPTVIHKKKTKKKPPEDPFDFSKINIPEHRSESEILGDFEKVCTSPGYPLSFWGDFLCPFCSCTCDNRFFCPVHICHAVWNFGAGLTKCNILEVILGYAQKVISNHTNHLAKTPVDTAFQKFEWHKEAAWIPLQWIWKKKMLNR